MLNIKRIMLFFGNVLCANMAGKKVAIVCSKRSWVKKNYDEKIIGVTPDNRKTVLF